MSLEKWAEYGWLKAEASSPDEIRDLLGIVTRALKDSKVEAISEDLRFQAAFSAALTSANIALRQAATVPGCKPVIIRRSSSRWNSHSRAIRN